MTWKRGTLIALTVIALAACGAAPKNVAETEADSGVVPAAQTVEETAEAPAAVRHDVVYVCNCGPECTCNSISVSPGTCSCGQELVWAHVVKVEGDEALLCTCGEGCTCALDTADPTKCGCGKPIRRMSLKGTGLYFCNCGGECTCNHISDKPGTCGCGMELKTAA